MIVIKRTLHFVLSNLFARIIGCALLASAAAAIAPFVLPTEIMSGIAKEFGPAAEYGPRAGVFALTWVVGMVFLPQEVN